VGTDAGIGMGIEIGTGNCDNHALFFLWVKKEK